MVAVKVTVGVIEIGRKDAGGDGGIGVDLHFAVEVRLGGPGHVAGGGVAQVGLREVLVDPVALVGQNHSIKPHGQYLLPGLKVNRPAHLCHDDRIRHRVRFYPPVLRKRHRLKPLHPSVGDKALNPSGGQVRLHGA